MTVVHELITKVYKDTSVGGYEDRNLVAGDLYEAGKILRQKGKEEAVEFLKDRKVDILAADPRLVDVTSKYYDSFINYLCDTSTK